MNNFFEGLKNQNSTFCICADSFKKILLPCYREIKRWSFALLLWKHLLLVKIIPVTLFKLLVGAYRNPPVILEAFHQPEMILKRVTILLFITGGWLTVGTFKGWIEVHNPIELGGGGRGDSDAASGKISIISKCFHRSKQELFETLKMQKNIKSIGPYTESTDFIFKASWHCPFKRSIFKMNDL